MNNTFTPNEFILLSNYFNNATNYLEFGCGQSTVVAAKNDNIKNIISFDSSIKWINNVKDELVGTDYFLKCNFIHLDIGEVKEWGYPINIPCSTALNYSLKFIQHLPIGMLYDFIFIDGRYRVSTFLFSSLFLKENGYIAIHDYVNRPWYFTINDFFHIVQVQDSLYIFQKKEDMDIQSLIRIASYYVSDAR